MSKQRFTVIFQREEDMFVAICPELDIASQGANLEEARENITEAIELFLEEASPQELQERLPHEQYIGTVEVGVG